MKEQLISFETAKLAKEKGFNITNRNSYDENTGLMLPLDPYGHCYALEGTCPAPTQSLLQGWLREIHDIHIITKPYIESLGKKEITGYYIPTIYTSSLDKHIEFDDNYSTYEEALEMGLQEALKLIPNNL